MTARNELCELVLCKGEIKISTLKTHRHSLPGFQEEGQWTIGNKEKGHFFEILG